MGRAIATCVRLVSRGVADWDEADTHLYRCYRAYVRGKVLGFRLDDAEFSEEERKTSATRARNYFELARRYALRLQRPTVIVVCGLSGTGKTSVSRAIAGELGLRVISADAMRKSLFGDAMKPSGYDEGAYTGEAKHTKRGRSATKWGACLAPHALWRPKSLNWGL